MWETRHSIVDWVCVKTQTLLVILRTQNQPLEVCLVYCWKKNMCSSQLDVQETDCCLAQFYRIRNHFSECWIACGWVDCSCSLAHSDWSTTFNQQQCPTQTYEHAGNWCDSPFPNQDPTCQKKTEGYQLSDVDYVPTNTHSSHNGSQLYIFEDNETVIKMIIKGRSPTMRHVSRTHRVALDWLFDRINLEPKIQIKFVNTQILTKGSFSRDEWNHLLCLFSTMNFSMYSCSHFSNFLSDDLDQIGKQNAMRKEVRRRLRMKALQRRKRSQVWCCASKGVRESLHEVWDLRSIRECRWKKRSLKSNQATGATGLKFKNWIFSSESTRKFSTSKQETGAGGSKPNRKWWEKLF